MKAAFFYSQIMEGRIDSHRDFSSIAARPAVPINDGMALGVDARLASGKPREFYESRAKANPDCVKDLDKAKEDFREVAKQIKELKAKRSGLKDAEVDAINKDIDRLGADLGKKRSVVLKWMDKCGECSVQEVTGVKVASVSRTENWYVSDGSCQIPSKDPAVLKAAFKKISESLQHAKRYPHYSEEGGFTNILDFQIAKVETKGKDITKISFDPKVDLFTGAQNFLGIWVRGIPGFNFRYFISAEQKLSPSEDAFHLKFETVPSELIKLKEVPFPEISDYTASGKATPVKASSLKNVIGAWYLNSDGYLRYYTAAEFLFMFDKLKDIARSTLLDTLWELSERGEWEQE
jgi:hypothetical protein